LPVPALAEGRVMGVGLVAFGHGRAGDGEVDRGAAPLGVPLGLGGVGRALGGIELVGVADLDVAIRLGGVVEDFGGEGAVEDQHREDVAGDVLLERVDGRLVDRVVLLVNAAGEGVIILVVLGPDDHGLLDAADLSGVLELAGRLAGLAQGGEEDADEQGDDGDNHQQLDQRKGLAAILHFRFSKRCTAGPETLGPPL
jgi:hypothetical protein